MISFDLADTDLQAPGTQRYRPTADDRNSGFGSALGLQGLTRLLSRSDRAKFLRYGATSLIALAISEITLMGLFAGLGLDATAAALVANLAGTVPSYLLSRYWIWSEADRARPTRQVMLYWLVSLVTMLVSSGGTGAISDLAPTGHMLRLIVVGASYLFVSLALWVAKYFFYQKVIFTKSDDAAPECPTISLANELTTTKLDDEVFVVRRAANELFAGQQTAS